MKWFIQGTWDLQRILPFLSSINSQASCDLTWSVWSEKVPACSWVNLFLSLLTYLLNWLHSSHHFNAIQYTHKINQAGSLPSPHHTVAAGAAGISHVKLCLKVLTLESSICLFQCDSQDLRSHRKPCKVHRRWRLGQQASTAGSSDPSQTDTPLASMS